MSCRIVLCRSHSFVSGVGPRTCVMRPMVAGLLVSSCLDILLHRYRGRPTPFSRLNFLRFTTISMEVVSLMLGIAPLIISAVENYETTFQPFVAYRRYSREIDQFTTRLAVQRTIFNNQCQLLLSAAEKDGRPEDVLLENILKDPNHSSRQNEALSNRLEKLLGTSLRDCISILPYVSILNLWKKSNKLSQKVTFRTQFIDF